MSERIFERLDTLEDAVKQIAALLLAYVEADLAQTWQPSAEALATRLRAILDKL